MINTNAIESQLQCSICHIVTKHFATNTPWSIGIHVASSSNARPNWRLRDAFGYTDREVARNAIDTIRILAEKVYCDGDYGALLWRSMTNGVRFSGDLIEFRFETRPIPFGENP